MSSRRVRLAALVVASAWAGGAACSSTDSDPPTKPRAPPPPIEVVVDAGPPPDPALDPTFGSNGVLGVSEIMIRDFAIDSRSRIVLGGERYRLDSTPPAKEDGMHVRRLAEDGKADATFGQSGAVSVSFPELTEQLDPNLGMSHLFLEANDGVLFSGQKMSVVPSNGDTRNRSALARLLPDGALAPNGGRVILPIGDIVKESQYDRLLAGFALSDGRMLYAGSRGGGVLLVRSSPGASTPGYGDYDVRVFPGTLTTMNRAVAAEQVVRTKTGDIVVAGNGAGPCVIALVSEVEGETKVRTIFERKDAHLSRIVVDADGNVVVAISAPYPTDAVIARIRPDGTLDPTFGSNGEVPASKVVAVAVDAEQRVLVLENDSVASPSSSTVITGFRVRRLLHDGSLDSGFHDHGTLSSMQMARACPTCSPEALDCLKSSKNSRQLVGLLADGKGRGLVISRPTGGPIPHCLVRFIP